MATASSLLPKHGTAVPNNGRSGAGKPNGESHRVYWQQWLKSSSASTHELSQGRRELITSSAAIRISAGTAKAQDVTRLLRKTLNLSAFASSNETSETEDGNARNGRKNEGDDDSLVLVGTLYSVPRDYVRFEHDVSPFLFAPAAPTGGNNTVPSQDNPRTSSASSANIPLSTSVPTKAPATSSSSVSLSTSQASMTRRLPPPEPYHVIKTLHPLDNPLQVRDRLIQHLNQVQRDIEVGVTATQHRTPNRPVIAPKIQWYYVPGHRSTPPTSPIPSCIDLDGYCTSLEDDDYGSDDDNDSDVSGHDPSVYDMSETKVDLDDRSHIDVRDRHSSSEPSHIAQAQTKMISIATATTNTSLLDRNVVAAEESKQDHSEAISFTDHDSDNDSDTLRDWTSHSDHAISSILSKLPNSLSATSAHTSPEPQSSHSLPSRRQLRQQRRNRRNRRRQLQRYVQLSQSQAAGHISWDDDQVHRQVLNEWPPPQQQADGTSPAEHPAGLLHRHLYHSPSTFTAWACDGIHTCISGYLLHQSHADPHVWRRVFCVLTEEHFWFVTRVTNHYEDRSLVESDLPAMPVAMYHGKICLGKTMLLEPEPPKKNGAHYVYGSNAPLHRIPHSFELEYTQRKGGSSSHVFRASNRRSQQNWIVALQERIQQLQQENSIFAHAELIVTEETIARNQRKLHLAVEPLLQAVGAHRHLSPVKTDVLMWGIRVTEFRERCRHIQAILPARQPVTAHKGAPSTNATLSTRIPSQDNRSLRARMQEDASSSSLSSPQQQVQQSHQQTPPKKDALSRDIDAMSSDAWQEAFRLLLQANALVTQLQTKPTKKFVSSRLETICRHIDYMIMGEFQSTAAVVPDHDMPPPVDLFDPLLKELQLHANR